MESSLASTLVILVAVEGAGGVFWERGTCTSAERGEYHQGRLDVEDNDIWPSIIKRYDGVDDYMLCFTRCFATDDCLSIYWDAGSLRCFTLTKEMNVLRSMAATSGNYTEGSWIGGPLEMQNSLDKGRKRYANCDNFCTFPGAACVKDCPSDPVSCAVEQSTCTESMYSYVTKIYNPLSQHYWHYTARNLFDIQFTKKYANTHLRFRVVSQADIRSSYTGSTVEKGVYIRPYIYNPTYGTRDCYGRNNVRLRTAHTVHSRQNYPGWGHNSATQGYNFEGICEDIDWLPRTDMRFRMREDCLMSCNGHLGFKWGYYHQSFIEIEEVVPSGHFQKMDESSLCPERTSFNVEQRDFSSQVYVSGNNQLVSNFYMSFRKRSPTSTLRLYLRSNVYNNWSNKVKRFEFKVNGQRGRDICSDGNDLVASILWYTYGETSTYKSHKGSLDFSLDTICRGMVAGTYTFQLYSYWGVDAPPGRSQGPNYYSGHGGETAVYIGMHSSSNMIIEEVNEGVPVSAVLMNDGTLRRFQYFNRRYSLHGNAIENVMDFSGKNPFTYTKLHDDSVLHIRYYGGYGHKMDGQHAELCKYVYIHINGYACNDPNDIRRKYYVKWAHSYYSKPEYFEGFCRRHSGDSNGIKAGSYTFTINGASCGNNRYSILGSGTTGHWMIQEQFM